MDEMSVGKSNFVFPRLLKEELGELERVAGYVNDSDKFISRFLQATLPRSESSWFAELPETIWKDLKNTDSVGIAKGDWEAVQRLCEGKRDWKSTRSKMEKGERMDAPIIVLLANEYHLVSGNTRLMCAKALGIVPKVLIVDLSDEFTVERD